MASEPQRREFRRTHLDASVVPVERALLARADALDEVGKSVALAGERDMSAAEMTLGAVMATVGQEFRALAEELHWH